VAVARQSWHEQRAVPTAACRLPRGRVHMQHGYGSRSTHARSRLRARAPGRRARSVTSSGSASVLRGFGMHCAWYQEVISTSCLTEMTQMRSVSFKIVCLHFLHAARPVFAYSAFRVIPLREALD
jgi:hypothetical protein